MEAIFNHNLFNASIALMRKSVSNGLTDGENGKLSNYVNRISAECCINSVKIRCFLYNLA